MIGALDPLILTCAGRGGTLPPLRMVPLAGGYQQQRQGLGVYTFPVANLDANVVTHRGWTGAPVAPLCPVALRWTHRRGYKVILQISRKSFNVTIDKKSFFYSSLQLLRDESSCSGWAATWGTLEADVVVGAHASIGLLLVDAPETFLQAGVHHFPSVCSCHPVCGPGLHGHGSCTDPLPVIESDGFQAFVVPVPSRVVDVEPRGPLCHPWRHIQGQREWAGGGGEIEN